MDIRKYLALGLLAFLVACSSNDDIDEQPAELIDFEEEQRFKRLWSNNVGNGQGGIYNLLEPGFDTDTAYVAAANGDIEAIALQDGDTLWSEDLNEPLTGGVGVGVDIILLGANNGDVIALNKRDGSQLWRTAVGAEVLAPATFGPDLAYLQTLDGQILALDLEQGDVVWSFRSTMPPTSLRGTSIPLLFREQVIAGFANGKLMSFDAASGALNWEVRVALPQGNSEIERIIDIDAPLLLEDNIVYAVSYQGNIIAVDPSSGRKLWERDASSYVAMAEGFSNIYVVAEDGSITAYIKNGQGVRWTQTVLARRKLTGATTLGSYILVGDFEGYMHALSQVDGRMAARTRVDSDGLRVRLRSFGDTVYTYSNDGKLSAYQFRQ